MPPKPLAEDLARKKAEREKADKAQKALAILEKPSGFEQTVNAIKDPVGTVKQLGRIGKETFYDPIIGLSDAANPFIEQKPIDRVNKALGGALTAADAITPFVPEGTIANSLRREAMERLLDDEVARYAASGGGEKYRGTLIAHGSPETSLQTIEARRGSYALPDRPAAFGVNLSETLSDAFDWPDPEGFVKAVAEMDGYARGATAVDRGGMMTRQGGAYYIGRVPAPNRVIRQYLPDGTVQIAGDRFDNYVVSNADIPVLSEARPSAYESLAMRDRIEMKPGVNNSNLRQGPAIPRYSEDYADGSNTFISDQESAVIDALKRAPLRPGERKQVDRLLAELRARRRYVPDSSDF
jgi:hypothetical protein